MTDRPILNVWRAEHQYGARKVLRGIDLALKPGEIAYGVVVDDDVRAVVRAARLRFEEQVLGWLLLSGCEKQIASLGEALCIHKLGA